jgi:hypothetical protein
MGDNSDKPDDLLDKLDGFLRSGRKHYRRNKPPVLTDALPEDVQGSIPTLTNAIENSRDESTDKEADEEREHEEHVRDAVASRLVASVDREMADLSEAYPDFQAKLALLHRSIQFALPQLVNLRWEDTDDDAVEGDGDAITADDDGIADEDGIAAEDSGTNPDQQS